MWFPGARALCGLALCHPDIRPRSERQGAAVANPNVPVTRAYTVTLQLADDSLDVLLGSKEAALQGLSGGIAAALGLNASAVRIVSTTPDLLSRRLADLRTADLRMLAVALVVNFEVTVAPAASAGVTAIANSMASGDAAVLAALKTE